MKRRAAALTLAFLALPVAARAQPREVESAAAAQALYDAARDRMERGLFHEACPKLEEALRLAPAAVGAKLRLGECYAGLGRFASAWSMLVAAEGAARAAGQADREQRARELAAVIEPRLSKLTITVPASLRDLPGLAVERDGAAIGPGQWGEAIPVDGGNHTILARAPSKAPWSATVSVPEERGAVVVEIGPLLDLRAAPPSITATAITPPVIAPPPIASPPRPPAWIWITGAAGLALAATGAAFGADNLAVASRQADLCGPARDHCERAVPAYDPASDNARRARDYGLFLGFATAGGALVAASVIGLAVTARRAPPPVAPSAFALPSGGGLSLRGRF